MVFGFFEVMDALTTKWPCESKRVRRTIIFIYIHSRALLFFLPRDKVT